VKLSFKILEHPSDLGIEAYGKSMQEVFRNAALGLVSIVAGASKIEPRQKRIVKLQALDRENLMVRWLTEVLYLYDTEKFLSADFEFETLTDTSLKAGLIGEQYDESKHELELDIKAVTYHHLSVEDHNGDWMAQVFLDV
jgi:SHS2 domain-containing protein